MYYNQKGNILNSTYLTICKSNKRNVLKSYVAF